MGQNRILLGTDVKCQFDHQWTNQVDPEMCVLNNVWPVYSSVGGLKWHRHTLYVGLEWVMKIIIHY